MRLHRSCRFRAGAYGKTVGRTWRGGLYLGPGDVLQGRFSNLSCWTVPYVGDHCTAPCGLAGVRISRDGQVGCMGSLGVPAEDLPKTPRGKHTATVDRLFQNPVPCVQQLREYPNDLVDFIVADLNDRQTP